MPISKTEEPRMPPGLVGPMPKRLGRYEIIDRLAIGGMAEVFVGFERGLGGLERLAVIKRILPQLAVHGAFVEMFLAEARYVARLNHPNVVQVFELAEDENGAPFLAMEYIAGHSVREVIIAAMSAGAVVPVGAAVGLIVQACAGAHAAHELTDAAGAPLGLVHRDLSPHNLMVTAEGHVRLLDFGIAKATVAALMEDQTRTGGLKGKVHYMSPEQCRQEPLDRRSDVFSLAIVLWETLAEERLFKRPTELESIHAIIDGERRDLSAIRADVPRALVEIVERALAPKKEDRFLTAAELKRVLLEACALQGINCGAEEVAAFVRPLLGEVQRKREQELMQRAHSEGSSGARAEAAIGDAREKSSRAPTQRARDEARADVEAAMSEVTADLAMYRTGEASAEAPKAVSGLPMPVRKRRMIVPSLMAFGLALGVSVGVGDRLLRESGEPMVIGFPPTADAKLMLEDTEALRRWLEDSLERPATVVIAKSYEDLEARLLSGELALAALPPYLYVETKARDPGVELVATKLVEGSSGNDSILYVGEGAAISGIAELKGKKLCFPDAKSTTGYLFPRLALKKAGLDPDRDVESHMSGSHMQALRDLVGGVCDAAATYSGGFLAADRSGIPVARIKQLAIIGRSPHQALVVPSKTPLEERKRIQNALLTFEPKDGGRRGRVERISGFRTPEEADYARVEEALSGAAGAGTGAK